MSYYDQFVIVGGRAGALICYDLMAEQVFNMMFLEYYFSKSNLRTRSKVEFLDGPISNHLDKLKNYFVATGDNYMRQKITNEIIEKTGIPPNNLCHPTATISRSAEIGYGNLILAGSVIHSNAKVGNGCIINTNSTVEHDNVIGDYCQISPGATLCGYVKIGDHSMISANATVIPNVNIAPNTVVGAGAVVTEDITEEFCLYAGIPATLKKKYENKTI